MLHPVVELRCPKCKGEVINRVMDAQVVDQAYYEDGKLVVKEVKYDVHESFIECAKCKNTEWGELEAPVEEIFL